MALIVDASGFYTYVDADEPFHAEVNQILLSEPESLVTTELILAEVDYLVLRRLGISAEFDLLDDLTSGIFTIECLTRDELREARMLVERYRDLRLGLADASLVVLARRYRTNRILTFDERAFRQVTPLQGGYFVLLPADAQHH